MFVDLKWFESKVGNKYLNEAAGLAAEEADAKDMKKSKVNISSMQPDGWYTKAHINLSYLHLKSSQTMSSLSLFQREGVRSNHVLPSLSHVSQVQF